MKTGKQDQIHPASLEADQLEIIYYTDPLCCWSWAMEPQLRRIQYEYTGAISWRYCMGGMLAGWQSYHDEINNVSRPIQMGPVWMHAQQLSGMPMDTTVWMRDPPGSSYPCCIAFKCAALQTFKAGTAYLRLLREAIMIHGKNIAKEEVLNNLAEQLADNPAVDFNLALFLADMKNGNGVEAFREDIKEIQYKQVKRFPTFVIRGSGQNGLILTGYRPYTALQQAMLQVNPSLQKTFAVIDPGNYAAEWGYLTEREKAEIISR